MLLILFGGTLETGYKSRVILGELGFYTRFGDTIEEELRRDQKLIPGDDFPSFENKLTAALPAKCRVRISRDFRRGICGRVSNYCYGCICCAI